MEHFVLPNSGLKRDDEGSKLGMWLFLYTEVLLFGGLFIVYTMYRYMYPDAFLQGSYHLSIPIGTINTIVLLTSSLTVAMGITALQKGNKKLALALMILTIVFALIFMVNKYFEWSAKIEHGIFPGMDAFMQLPQGETLFFFLYFFMTGLHALHIIVGAALIGIVVMEIKNDKQTSTNFAFTENAGLYWHLVDLIWIFLFPLFYLIH